LKVLPDTLHGALGCADPAFCLDVYSGMALAVTSKEAQGNQFTGEELQVKFLSDSDENSLKY
jgi:hypothetical protein